MIDLLVYVPDTHIENAIKTLILNRYQSLNIKEISIEIHRCINCDPGVYKTTSNIYRLLHSKYDPRKFLVILDNSWESNPGKEIVIDTIKKNILMANIQQEDFEVIIIVPEIEQWVWTLKPDPLAKAFEKSKDEILTCASQYKHKFGTKPKDPKEMLENFRKYFKHPISANTFKTLALNCSLRNCKDESFHLFIQTLQKWFPSNVSYNIP